MNMKNLIKIFAVLFFTVMIISNLTSVYGFGTGFHPDQVPVGNLNNNTSKITNATGKIFNSVILILQVLSVAGIVFTGIKYMFLTNSANKAEMKESMVFLIIGMVIVFGASSVIQFIVNSAKEVL